MGARTSRKTVTPAALPASFIDGLPDHVAAYVRKVLPRGLRTGADLMKLMSRSMVDLAKDRIDATTANIINRQAGRLLRATEQRLG